MSAAAGVAAAALVCAVAVWGISPSPVFGIDVAKMSFVGLEKYVDIGDNSSHNYYNILGSEIPCAIRSEGEFITDLYSYTGCWGQRMIGRLDISFERDLNRSLILVKEEYACCITDVSRWRFSVIGNFYSGHGGLLRSKILEARNVGVDISPQLSFRDLASVENRSLSRQPKQNRADEQEAGKSSNRVSEGSMQPMPDSRDERPNIAVFQFALGVVFLSLAALLNTYESPRYRWRLVAAYIFGVLGVCAFGLGMIVLN